MQEIERKYLVKIEELPNLDGFDSFQIRQGYLVNDPEKSIRLRTKNDKAYLTFKLGKNPLNRREFEYVLPSADALELLEAWSAKTLSKTRYLVPFEGHLWELDCFHGYLEGLWLVEIELQTESESFALPQWVGEEVTQNPAYLNANLIKKLS
jgi:CYTH domain-containing protein